MKSIVSIRSIPGASTNGMVHRLKECLEYNFTSWDKRSEEWLMLVNTTDIVNLALTMQSEKKLSFHFRIDYQK